MTCAYKIYALLDGYLAEKFREILKFILCCCLVLAHADRLNA